MFVPNAHHRERSTGIAMFLFWLSVVAIPALALGVH